MKNFVSIAFIILVIIGCNSSKNISKEPVTNLTKNKDTLRIANDSLEYEIIIIDPGFNSWFVGNAKPRGYYSETYLESRNYLYVMEWNNRVLQPMRYSPNLYEMQIDYQPNIHYGYEVNYMLYNYFIYFQIANKQQLAGFVPRP